MEKIDHLGIYNEQFPFRKRTLYLKKKGVLVQENSFFKKTETFIPFEKIGRFIQYNHQRKVGDVFVIIAFCLFGARALYVSKQDSILFGIGVILIGVSVYWIASVIGKVEYIGNYYFSSESGHGGAVLEIKTKYPPGVELQKFIKKLRELQVAYLIDYKFKYLVQEIPLNDYLRELLSIKNDFDLDDDQYNSWITSISEQYASLKNS